MRLGLSMGLLAAAISLGGCTSEPAPPPAEVAATTPAKKSLADLWTAELAAIDTDPCVGSGGTNAVAVRCETVLVKVGGTADLVKKDAQIRSVPTVVAEADKVSTAAQSWTAGACRDATDPLKTSQCFNDMLTVINGPFAMKRAIADSGR